MKVASRAGTLRSDWRADCKTMFAATEPRESDTRMIVGVLKETMPGERRVAMVPAALAALTKLKLDVLLEAGAGQSAGFRDEEYSAKGARIAADRSEVFTASDVLIQVRTYGANPDHGRADVAMLKRGQIVIGMSEPLSAGAACQEIADRGATLMALEMIPRITRAQSMDVLSSMATIAGYKAVLLAADALPRMFPMLMTAAGTVTPARVLVIGAGVAGLQAIATARRLGALVSGYDIRPAVKEQIESLGAKFIVLDLQTGTSEDKGGYAKAMDEAFYKRQRELMTAVIREHDVVISTAAVPGKKAPILVTADMVRAMAPGSVVVDVAAERGGNCELTRPGETVVEGGVTILGPLNLPATIPYHASTMYARNVGALLKLMTSKEGQVALNFGDEVIRETVVTHDGKVVHPRVREAAGMPPLPAEPAGAAVAAAS